MYRNPAQGTSAAPEATGGTVWQAFLALANALLAQVWSWRYRARYRRQLAELDDYLLRDIGISRLDARAEYTKPFWQL